MAKLRPFDISFSFDLVRATRTIIGRITNGSRLGGERFHHWQAGVHLVSLGRNGSPLPESPGALRFPLLLTALMTAPALAATQPVAPHVETAADGSQRWSFLVTYGDEACPPAQGDEIVVCARLPESERYRIPAPLREPRVDTPAMGASWTAQVESYENVARLSRPDSCSSVGSYGWSGCAAKALRDWFEERRLIEAEAAEAP
jgi:hypothetical protein